MVKLGILGGTFDPIHQGHLAMARHALAELNLAQVIFVPAGAPPHKRDQQITAARHRLAMLEQVLAAYPHFILSRVDVDRPGPHYAVDMVAMLKAEYDLSAEGCFFIIGSDSLIGLPDWHAPALLLARCRLAVIPRPGYEPQLNRLYRKLPGLKGRLDWVDMPADPVSSTALRRRLARGEDVSDQIPGPAWRYIQVHDLYRA